MVAVTYNAPEGDNEVVHTHGLKFFNGQTLDLDEQEHKAFLDKAKGNRHFLVGDQTAEEPYKGMGEPKNVDMSADIDRARDHDFEGERRRRGRPPKTEKIED